MTNYPIEEGKPFYRDQFYSVPPTRSNEYQDMEYDIPLRVSGAFEYYLFPEVKRGAFVVQPVLLLKGVPTPVEAICAQTVISQCLGPIEQWITTSDPAKPPTLLPTLLARYNMLHFTPVSELGASRSAYSIRSQRVLNPNIFGGDPNEARVARLRNMLIRLREEYGVASMVDVVWNHSATNSPWLAQHPEATYNLTNSSHLIPAYEVDCMLLRLNHDIIADSYDAKRAAALPAGLRVSPKRRARVRANIENASDLEHLRAEIRQRLKELRLWEYEVVHVDNTLALFRQALESRRAYPHGVSGHAPPAPHDLDAQVRACIVQQPTGGRWSYRVNIPSAVRLFAPFHGDNDSKLRLLRESLDRINLPRYQVVDQDIECIANNVANGVKYQRIDAHGPKLGPVTSYRPLVWSYFHHLPTHEWQGRAFLPASPPGPAPRFPYSCDAQEGSESGDPATALRTLAAQSPEAVCSEPAAPAEEADAAVITAGECEIPDVELDVPAKAHEEAGAPLPSEESSTITATATATATATITTTTTAEEEEAAVSAEGKRHGAEWPMPQGLPAVCNGWIFCADPRVDFAAPGSRSYVRREVVIWGDCVKLRYGKGPADSPFLWEHMRKYTELMASLFDGVRIDNCHTTPIHVAQYFLDAARRARPDLVTFAELFTCSEELDVEFCSKLGLTCLLREAHNAHSPGAMGGAVYATGGLPVGLLDPHTREAVPLKSRGLNAMLSDCTHDNPTPIRSRTAEDTLATAALVAAAPCPVLSVRGYDELFPDKVPTTSARHYGGLDEKHQGILPARRLINELHAGLTRDGYNELYVHVDEGHGVVSVLRSHPGTHDGYCIIARCAFHHDGVDTHPGHELHRSAFASPLPASQLRNLLALHAPHLPKAPAESPGIRLKPYLATGASGAPGASGPGTPMSLEAEEPASEPGTPALGEEDPNMRTLPVAVPGSEESLLTQQQEAFRVPLQPVLSSYPNLGAHWFPTATPPSMSALTAEVEEPSVTRRVLPVGSPPSEALSVAERYGYAAPPKKRPARLRPYATEVGGCVESLYCFAYLANVEGPPSHSAKRRAKLPLHGLASDLILVPGHGVNALAEDLHTAGVRLEADEDNPQQNTRLKFSHLPPGAICILKVSLPAVSRNALSQLREHAPPLGVSHATLPRWMGIEHCWGEAELRSAVDEANLDGVDINTLLFGCAEEGGSVYDVPNSGRLPYGGFAGVYRLLTDIARRGDMGHPLLDNLRQGNWLIDYTVDRICRLAPRLADSALVRLIRQKFDLVREWLPRYLVPKYFDEIIRPLTRYLFEWATTSYLRLPSSLRHSPFVQRLCMTSFQMFANLPHTPLLDSVHPLHRYSERHASPSLAAGLPHFASGFMRNWGRDTFIALRGLFLVTGRFADARYLLLGYAHTVRHGLVPNLLAGGGGARFNARDATWWWLQAAQDYCALHPEADATEELLQATVPRRYEPTRFPIEAPTSGDAAPVSLEGLEFPAVPDPAPLDTAAWPEMPLAQVIQEVLQAHALGIHFREWRAGPQIDSKMRDPGFQVDVRLDTATGLLHGGNEWNAGTWMDKMGDSLTSGNIGHPATPRDGCPVEIAGLLKSTVRWLAELHAQKRFPYAGVYVRDPESHSLRVLTYQAWSNLIQGSFERCYYIPLEAEDSTRHDVDAAYVLRRGIYKDVLGSHARWSDYQLRPNQCVAMAVAPELFDAAHVGNALDAIEKHLLHSDAQPCNIGIATLDIGDVQYRPYYDQQDNADFATACGFSYHQGPEWVWVAGYFFRAFVRHSRLPLRELNERLFRFLLPLKHETRTSAWLSLPELTNARGHGCMYSCPAQSWSAATILDTLYDLSKLKSKHAQ